MGYVTVTHGIGAVSGGYRHNTIHLVRDDKADTLCGIGACGLDWWDTWMSLDEFLRVYEHPGRHENGDITVCLRCAMAYINVVLETELKCLEDFSLNNDEDPACSPV